jgi:putative transposase
MPDPYNPDRHHRRSIRLNGYDYTSPGAYFITLCTQRRQCLFGEVIDGEMRLNSVGEWVRSRWVNLPRHFPSVQLDEFVVMPNHVHGIIWLGDAHGRGEAFARPSLDFANISDANASPLQPIGTQPIGTQPIGTQPIGTQPVETRPIGTQPGSIGAIVQNFKSVSTRKINQMNQSCGRTVWQRDYYEHIIRDDRALRHIQQYIQSNPLFWHQDQLHPGNLSQRELRGRSPQTKPSDD